MRVWMIAALALGACDCNDAAPPPAPAPATEAAGDERPSGAPSGEAEHVTFHTDDDIMIAATLRRGGSPSAPAVVLVHRLGADRSEWDPLVASLSEAPGLTTLAIDVRGHGQSTAGADGATLSHGAFDTERWAATSKDVLAALLVVRGLDPPPASVGLVGSSIGATAALRAAAEQRVDALVLLSPGRAYRGVDGITPVQQIGQTELLTVAAEQEPSAVQAAQDLARIAPEGEVEIYAGSAHGMEIAGESPAMLERVTSFLRAQLTPR
jgi:pimeloyl-ACP methyl ester carboxylesterase